MFLKIADFIIDYGYRYERQLLYFKDYIIDVIPSDLYIRVSREEMEEGKANPENQDSLPPEIEFSCVLRQFAEWTPIHDAFLLHSACFDVNGTGVAFAAHSGTGKTTHMQLWQKLLGDKMTVVNGDKPIVRFFDDEPETPYAYGTPWNGKERLGCNMRTPLKHICFIERSENNYVEKIEKADAINRIFNQVYMPKDPIAMSCTLQLIERFISSCKLWIIHCNMDISAAETAYKIIFDIKE